MDVKLFIKCRLCLDEDGVYQIVPGIRELIKDCFDIDVSKGIFLLEPHRLFSVAHIYQHSCFSSCLHKTAPSLPLFHFIKVSNHANFMILNPAVEIWRCFLIPWKYEDKIYVPVLYQMSCNLSNKFHPNPSSCFSMQE